MTMTLRLGARALRRRFTTSILLWWVLGLGTGIPAAVLSAAIVVERPVVAARAAPVFRLFGITPTSSSLNLSPPDFHDFRAAATTIESLAAIGSFAPELTLTGRGQPRLVVSRRVTARFFQTLGVPLLAGREFSEAEEMPPARPAVLGEHFWREVLGGSTDVVGQILMLNGRPFNIVGVVAAHQEVLGRADIWLPVQFPSREIRGLRLLAVIGRLPPGEQLGATAAELRALAADLRAKHPETHAQSDVQLVRLDESIAGPLRQPMRLMSACALILWVLTACAAAAYALATARQNRQDTAIARALGGSPWQLWLAGALPHGLLVFTTIPLTVLTAGWTLAIIEGAELLTLPRSPSPQVAAAIAASLLLFVLAIMVTALRLVPIVERPDSTRGSHQSPGRAQRVVVAAESACAVVLVATAAVLTWAVVSVGARDIGFDPEDRLFARLTLPSSGSNPPAVRWQAIADALAGVAGVAGVGFTSELPHTGQDNPAPFTIASPDGRRVVAGVRAVTPEYLRMARLQLRSGRSLGEDDDERRPRVALVNRRLALELFGSEAVVGRVLAIGVTEPPITAEIVGVLSDIRHQSVWGEPAAEVYSPVSQVALPSLTLVVDSALPPGSLQSALTAAIRRVEPDMAVPALTRWADAVSARIAPHDRRARFAGVLALFAILLVGASLYAFITQTLEGRRQELAVRVALGCPPARVRRDMHISALLLTLLGAVPGAIAALAVARIAASTLGTSAVAVAVVSTAVSIAVLATTAVLAAWRPARDVAQLDAVSALRG